MPGDINVDGKIDENDLTSYMNYTGLKTGDSDFDGYISGGDLNGNAWLMPYDISNVATKLDGGVTIDEDNEVKLAGTLSYHSIGNRIQLVTMCLSLLKAKNLKSVNAFNLVFPYNPKEMQFVKVESTAQNKMRNLSYDRRHTDGSQVLYPTFVNVGDQPVVQGDVTLLVISYEGTKGVYS